PYLQTDAGNRHLQRARRRVAGAWSADRCHWKRACTPRACPRNSSCLIAVSLSNPTCFSNRFCLVWRGVSRPFTHLSGNTCFPIDEAPCSPMVYSPTHNFYPPMSTRGPPRPGPTHLVPRRGRGSDRG